MATLGLKRKTWYSILGLDAMPLSLKNLLLNKKYQLNVTKEILIFQLQDMPNVSVPTMAFGWLKTERKLWILLGEF
jgi:hypothetical protein